MEIAKDLRDFVSRIADNTNQDELISMLSSIETNLERIAIALEAIAKK